MIRKKNVINYIVVIKYIIKLIRILIKLDNKQKIYKVNKTIIIESIRYDVFYYLFTTLLTYFISMKIRRIYIIKNDLIFNHYDSNRLTDESKIKNKDINKEKNIINKTLYNLLFETIQRIINHKNVVVLKYSNILDINKIIKTGENKYDVKAISNHIDASHKRYFGGRLFDTKNKDHRSYAKYSYNNEMINIAIGKKIINIVNPDLYITIDGIYSTYGPIVSEMRKANIPVLIYQINGFKDRSMYIGEEHFSVNNISEHWKDYKQNKYSIELKRKINIFMEKRLLSLYSISKIEKNKIEKINQNNKKYNKTIVLFPNLPWDGAIKERDIMFNGMLDWLKQTVEWVREKQYYLIIREHPISLKKYNRYESAIELLKEILPNVDKINNLLLISGTEEISSYKLVREIADCSIVYNGTLGVEISYLGYPIIFAGNSPYSNKGVGYEPKSIFEYFNLMEKVSKESILFKYKKKEFMKNAEIAAAYQFIYNSYYCPIMPKVKDFYHSENKYWQSWDLDEYHIDPERCPAWKRTIERFLMPVGIN